MTISSELLQMIENMSEKPDRGEDHHHSPRRTQTVERRNKVRVITTAQVRRFTGSLTR